VEKLQKAIEKRLSTCWGSSYASSAAARSGSNTEKIVIKSEGLETKIQVNGVNILQPIRSFSAENTPIKNCKNARL